MIEKNITHEEISDVIFNSQYSEVEEIQQALMGFKLSDIYEEFGDLLECKGLVFPKIVNLQLIWKMLSSMYQIRKVSDAQEARQMAQFLFDDFIQYLNKKGLKIEITGKDETQDADLYYSNHQAFGLEATGAYGIVPTETQILLKDELTNMPIFGKVFQNLNPIVFERPKVDNTKENKKEIIKLFKAERKRVGEEVAKMIDDHSVLVFPEGTRSDKGDLGNFFDDVFKHPLQKKPDTKIAVITSYTHLTLPFKGTKLIDAIRAKIRKIPARIEVSPFTIPGEINLNSKQGIKQVQKEIRLKMETNLRRMLAEDIYNHFN